MSRRNAAMIGLAWVVIAGACAWRWWLAPRRAAAAAASAAWTSPGLEDARAELFERLRDAGLELELELDHPHARLAWRTPGRCIEVYELRIDEHFRDASVATFTGREPEHSRWTLSVAQRGRNQPILAVLARIEDGEAETETDTEAREHPRVRELWWSKHEVGPAAPDFACRRRSWDPLEDVLALGWPHLPDAASQHVWVGQRWRGAPVEGRCHETVCLDERGQFAHAQPCRARPWREQLLAAGDGVALLLGVWDDGHAQRGPEPESEQGPELGILTRRLALLDDGRPLLVTVELEHRWSGVRRSLELARIDDCSPRSLATPDQAPLIERARASWAAGQARPAQTPATAEP